MDSPRVRSASWAGLVAVGCLVIVPPRALVGLYPTLGAAFAVLVVAVVFSLAPSLRNPSPRGRASLPLTLVALMVLMTGSAVWSSVPLRTLYDALTCVALAGAAWIIARHGGATAARSGILLFGAIVIVASAVIWLVDPSAVLFENGGDLQGIYGNRNTFGLSLALVLAAVLASKPMGRIHLVLAVLATCVVGASIVLSGSRTGMVIAGAILLARALLLLAPRHPRIAVAVAALAATGIAAALLNPGAVLGALGRSSTLSGRTEIWDATAGLVRESPIWGNGFFISWPAGSAQNLAVADPGGPVSHAHNELLGWAVSLGILGVALIVVIHARILVAAARQWRRESSEASLWMLLTMVAILVRGLAEQAETNPQVWFVYVLVGVTALAGESARVTVPDQHTGHGRPT
jgi:exopolysaccharide production protein ExoQ